MSEITLRAAKHADSPTSFAFARWFSEPPVTAIIVNPLPPDTPARKFYQRLGFVPTPRQVFHKGDDCFVHRLTRADWLARNQGD